MAEKTTITTDVPKETMQEIFSGPALLSNRIYVTVTAMGVRLSFMEMIDQNSPPKFRTAVFLPHPDAFAFRDLLNKQMENVKFEVMPEKK